jgi:hypothetical protein
MLRVLRFALKAFHVPSNLVHFSTVQGSSIRVDCVPLLAKLTYLKSILDAHDIWVLNYTKSLGVCSASLNPTKITAAAYCISIVRYRQWGVNVRRVKMLARPTMLNCHRVSVGQTRDAFYFRLAAATVVAYPWASAVLACIDVMYSM